MYYTSILWDSEDDPDGNVQHIAEHDLGIEDVEWVLGAPDNEGTSLRGYNSRGHSLRSSRKTKVIYMERKTFRRIIRDRHLTEAEMVADEKIRSQVVQEFPPFDLAVPQAGCISEALRRAIQSSPKSVYQICKETGISQIVVSRFLSGERDIRLATADRLAKALGIEVASH